MPVLSMPPCMKFGEISATVTPSPICIGSRPCPPTDWLTRSAKLTTLALWPTVLMLARLLPMTLSFCWLAFNPDKLAENEPMDT
jgi:hypothetical protein